MSVLVVAHVAVLYYMTIYPLFDFRDHPPSSISCNPRPVVFLDGSPTRWGEVPVDSDDFWGVPLPQTV